MDELGFTTANALSWFPRKLEEPYILVQISAEHADALAGEIHHAVRRCYVADSRLQERVQVLEPVLLGTPEARQAHVIGSKIPDAGSVMSGDFGEILTYFYHAVDSHPQSPFGPKKWRLKEARTKAAPYSDVVHFILPSWPIPSEDDVILCSEVKTKATNGASTPIPDAIRDSAKDRTSRLGKTLYCLRDRAIGEDLGAVTIGQLQRFINATDYPRSKKRFYAVAVVCSSVAAAEILAAPAEASPDYKLIIISVPNLHSVYTAVFHAVHKSNLTEPLVL